MTIIIRSGATDTDVINVLYQNVLKDGTLSWSTQATGYNATNLTDDSTWNAWKPTAVPATVSVDYGSAVLCNALGIAAHDMATAGASFTLEYSTDNVSWSTASASHSPLTNDTILVLFTAVSARYWRVSMTGAVATIGIIKIGAALKFPCGVLSGHKALHHARKFELLASESIGGNFLNSRVLRMGAETNVNIGQVDRSWAEYDMAAFEDHYNRGGAFFYCGSPSVTPKDMGYCKRPSGASEMNVTWVEGDVLTDVSFDVRAYVPT